MDIDKIRSLLAIALLPTALVVIINTFINNFIIWEVVDIAYIAFPLIFTAACVRGLNCDMLIATLLWIPGLVSIYMITQGYSGIEDRIWSMTNMYQLLVYGYFGGTRLEIR